uniref:NADH dehydrogenase [ubiquinone] 1 alpha subcomplex subunit 13 n=1 Tax=Panagrolaimus sp. JU765 TaxID=591449 RepID=A0AC34RQU5_9BILA
MADKNFRQDMPPEGGYRKFNWNRTYPKIVWRPGIIIPTLVGCAAFGTYQGYAQKKHRQTEKFEDNDIMNAIQPFLTAERDRRWIKILKKNREIENELMKDVPGWKTGTWYGEPVYFTLGDKWWDPGQLEVFAHSPRKAQSDEYMFRHHSEYSAPKFYDKWIPEILGRYIW